jgi:hypothetical protein
MSEKIKLPGKRQFRVCKNEKEQELILQCDSTGRTHVGIWEMGKGCFIGIEPRLRDLKEMRDWLTRVIAYMERP